MSKVKARTYSLYTREALLLMAGLIRVARTESKVTVQELADRAGVSRGLIQRIEKGDPKCEVGVVFEVAYLLGLSLFDSDDEALSRKVKATQDKLLVLPKQVRKPQKEVDDDF